MQVAVPARRRADTAPMRALWIGLCCCAAAHAAAAGEPAPTTAEVRTFMAQVAAASRARDVEAIAAALSSDCRIEFRSVIGGREQVTLLTRAEYVKFLKTDLAALNDLSGYDYRSSTLKVSIDHEPPGATVVSRVHESFTVGEQRRVMDSLETARVERRDGALKLVAVSAETEGR